MWQLCMTAFSDAPHLRTPMHMRCTALPDNTSQIGLCCISDVLSHTPNVESLTTVGLNWLSRRWGQEGHVEWESNFQIFPCHQTSPAHFANELHAWCCSQLSHCLFQKEIDLCPLVHHFLPTSFTWTSKEFMDVMFFFQVGLCVLSVFVPIEFFTVMCNLTPQATMGYCSTLSITHFLQKWLWMPLAAVFPQRHWSVESTAKL